MIDNPRLDQIGIHEINYFPGDQGKNFYIKKFFFVFPKITQDWSEFNADFKYVICF